MAKVSSKPKLTKQDKLKQKVLDVARDLLREQDEDIESGIEEGIYEESENVETRAAIDENEKLFDEFEKARPCIYIYISGCNLQSIGATCDVDIEIFDQDNYDATDDKKDYRDGQTPEQWDEMIEKLKNKGEIKPVW